MGDSGIIELYRNLKKLNSRLSERLKQEYQRALPISELHSDRWGRAKSLGFGKGSSIYDSSYVFGSVIVGDNCWIGMFTVLDGSGGLSIGHNCTVSAGAQIYSHDNIKTTLSPETYPIEREPVHIGNNCYIGPNAVISKGVTIGDHCVVAASSLVKDSFPSLSIIAGVPAKRIGGVMIFDGKVELNYLNSNI